jgi:outer membrane protein
VRKTPVLLLFVLCSMSSVRATADPAALRLSLQGAIELALRKNTAVHEARGDLQIAQAQRAQARSGYWPRVNLMGGSIVMEEAQKFSVPPGNINFDLAALGLPAIPGVFDPSKPVTNTDTLEIPITEQWINFGLLTVTQPLFTGGMIRGYNHQAEHGLRFAKHSGRRTRQQVIRTVVRRFNDVLLTRKIAEIAESTLSKVKVVREITERVFDAGSQKVNKLDVLKTQMFVTSLESFVETLRQARKLAGEGLTFAIGLEGGTRVEPVASDFDLTAVGQSCAQSVKTALGMRPEVGQLKAGIAALQAGVDVAWSRYLPDLALTGGYLIDDKSIRFTDGHTFFGGLVLNFNLFEGFLTNARVREARARVDKLRHKERYLVQGVSLQVRKACMDIERAGKQVALTAKALRSAEEHLRLSDDGYQADLVEMEDLLKAQLMEAVMRFQHLKARYDLSNYQLDLRAAMGDLSAYLPRRGRR